MPEKIFEPRKPHGLSRIIFRLPIWIFRAHLGWILGYRFLLLIHTGRKSGQTYQTVLEIIRYDKTTGACVVASGWGKKSDWFKNIRANPDITFQVKNKRTVGVAVRLSENEAARELLRYAHQHPLAFQVITYFMGYQVDINDDDIYALGKLLSMFIFKPTS